MCSRNLIVLGTLSLSLPGSLWGEVPSATVEVSREVTAFVQQPQAPSRTSLKGIQKIYVEQIGRSLDQYITAELTRKFKGKVSVVLHAEDADAILIGAGRDYWGRMLWPGAVSLVDTNQRLVLWSSDVTGRYWRDIWRPDKVAERLVRDLRKALAEAEKGQ